MLKDLITYERIKLVKSAADWQDAIRLASLPLLEDGSITEGYVAAMIDIVKKYGPYIVLDDGIAMPHARPECGVNRMAMSLMRVEEKVYFDEEKYANLFFVLACADGTSHIEALKELAQMFCDDTALESFMNAPDRQAVIRVLEKYS